MFGRRTTPETTLPRPSAAASAASSHDDLLTEPEPLWAPAKATARKSVEQMLLDRGHITEEHLTQARSVQAQTPGKSIAQILLTMNAASEAQILSALAETLGLPFETPEKKTIDPAAYETLPVDYIRKHGVLPIRLENDNRTLVVGLTDPT